MAEYAWDQREERPRERGRRNGLTFVKVMRFSKAPALKYQYMQFQEAQQAPHTLDDGRDTGSKAKCSILLD